MKELAKALGRFQAKIRNVPFDSANPHFKNKYASLAGIIDHVRDGLAANELVVTQLVNRDSVKTMLIHVSGESLESETAILCAQQNNPQAYGSAVTYARRYSLAAILGIAADDDDDANVATAKTELKTTETDTITEAQSKAIYAIVNNLGWSADDAKDEIKKRFNVASSKELTKAQASQFLSFLRDVEKETKIKELGEDVK